MLFLAASPSPVRGPSRTEPGTGPSFSMPTMRGRKLFGPGGLGDDGEDEDGNDHYGPNGGTRGGSGSGRMAASSPFKPHSAAAVAAAAEEAAARAGYSSPGQQPHHHRHHQHSMHHRNQPFANLPEPTKSSHGGPFSLSPSGGDSSTNLGSAVPLGYGFPPGPSSSSLNRSHRDGDDGGSSLGPGGQGRGDMGLGPPSLTNPPATPGRDRQPSANGWESFINVSPSPQRPTPARTGTNGTGTGTGAAAAAVGDKLLGAGRKLAEVLGGTDKAGPPQSGDDGLSDPKDGGDERQGGSNAEMGPPGGDEAASGRAHG